MRGSGGLPELGEAAGTQDVGVFGAPSLKLSRAGFAAPCALALGTALVRLSGVFLDAGAGAGTLDRDVAGARSRRAPLVVEYGAAEGIDDLQQGGVVRHRFQQPRRHAAVRDEVAVE